MDAVARLRFPVTLALAISFTVVLASTDETEAAVPAGNAPARKAVPVADAVIRAQADSLAKLLEAGQLAETERGARLLLAEAERRHGPRSLEAAVALDVLVEALLNQGRGEPETKAMAERA